MMLMVEMSKQGPDFSPEIGTGVLVGIRWGHCGAKGQRQQGKGWESEVSKQFFWRLWAQRKDMEGGRSGLKVRAAKHTCEVEGHASCQVTMGRHGKKGCSGGV